MPIRAQAADGSIHEFPDDTQPAVVDTAMKQYAMSAPSKSAPANDDGVGAPAAVRAAVGAVPDADRLQTIRKIYPDAKPTGDGNFQFTDPKTGKSHLYNPSGLDMGDFASLLPEAAELVGGTVGAIGGGTGGSAVPILGTIGGAIGGAALGATTAREAVQRAAMAHMGVTDQRSVRDQIKEAATTAAMNAAGEGIGNLAAAGVKAGIRGLARGGSAGRQATADAVSDLERFGATPSAAQATSNAALDTTESFIAKVPGGAGVIRQAAQKQSEAVAAGMAAKVAALNKGTVPDVLAAGNAAAAGVEGFAKDFSDKADVLYGKLDSYLPADTAVPVTNTERTLGELVTPAKGAVNVSKTLANPTLVRLQDALGQDASNGAVTYSVLKDLRSTVGRRLGSPSLHDDIPRAQLKQVYGALTSDLRAAAQSQGNDAVKAFDRANTYYKAGIDRMDTMLDPLVRNKLPEQAFAAISSSASQGPSRIIALRKSVSPDQWRAIAGTVADRLGKAKPGFQGTEADAFSFQNFLSNWQKLPDKSKDVLFSGPNMNGIRGDLDALARASDRIRISSKAFANPSGSGGVAIGGAMILGSVASALSGHIGGAAGLAGAIPAAHYGAKLLTSRPFVRWLAQSTKIRPAGVAAHIGRLGAIAANSDPDTRDAITGLLGTMQQTPDQPDNGAQ
jgi:hypothetical protein